MVIKNPVCDYTFLLHVLLYGVSWRNIYACLFKMFECVCGLARHSRADEFRCNAIGEPMETHPGFFLKRELVLQRKSREK